MVNEPTRKSSASPLPEMAQLVKLIMKMGPDIDKIARISGQYKETIRYRYKEKILGKGFSLQARVNFEGFGLQRVVMKVKLGAEYNGYARELFLAMNQLCFVTSFTGLLPEGSYMIHANVPREFKNDFVDLMKKLAELGVFNSIDFYTFDWFRNVPMKAEYYDFEHGVWEYDWAKPVEHVKDDNETGFEPFHFDKMDLLILKELQRDATRSLSEIRDAIKENDGIDINYKTLAWHWIRHVQEKRMLNGYALRWMGTRYDSVADKAKHRQHRYVMVPVFVKGVSDSERLALVAEMNQIPFLWCEAAGADYHAQLAFPVEMVNDAFSFLSTVVSQFGSRASYNIVDQTNSLGFVMPYQLFDDQQKKWSFQKMEVFNRFQSLIIKIRESSGPNRTLT
jgi:hypothetical protein